MSFADKEVSLKAGQPFHLYRFTHGPDAGDVLAYTALRDPVSYLAQDYEPLPITHSDIVSSGTLDKSTLTITVPDSGPLADLYKDEMPQGVVRLTIFQGHVGESDFKVCFSGRVLSGSFSDDKLELQAEPISSSMRRPGLNRDWQLHCPHVLYGSRCRADRAAATRGTTVASVSGPLVTLASGWAPSDLRVKHRGGVFTWTDGTGRVHRRSIEDVTGDVVRLASVISSLPAGAAVSVTLGCDHTLGDCKDLHDNRPNFGGQPQIPLKNPTGIVNNYQ